MGKNLNIYVSDEALVSLEKKKKQGEFNLSAFVSTSLLRDDQVKCEDVEMLEQQVSQKRAQIQLVEAEINTLLLKIKEIVNKNNCFKEEKERDERWNKFKMEMEKMSDNEEMNKEYKEGLKEGKWRSWVDFCKIKLGWKE